MPTLTHQMSFIIFQWNKNKIAEETLSVYRIVFGRSTNMGAGSLCGWISFFLFIYGYLAENSLKCFQLNFDRDSKTFPFMSRWSKKSAVLFGMSGCFQPLVQYLMRKVRKFEHILLLKSIKLEQIIYCYLLCESARRAVMAETIDKSDEITAKGENSKTITTWFHRMNCFEAEQQRQKSAKSKRCQENINEKKSTKSTVVLNS